MRHEIVIGGPPASNGMLALWHHPTTSDQDAVTCAAGVPWSHSPWLYCQEAEAGDPQAAHCPTILLPGQIGWEVWTCSCALDYTTDADGALVTPPVCTVGLYDTLGVALHDYPVQAPVFVQSQPYPAYAKSIEEFYEQAQWMTAGPDKGTTGVTPVPGLLWTAAAKYTRKVIIKIEWENAGLLHVYGRPVWDHKTAIANMQDLPT
jgi:hypothetical protein